MRTEKLIPTAQKSYYGKATVIYNDDGTVDLKSYDTIVARIQGGKFIRLWGGYSNTTKRHINDFRALFNFEPINKKEWESLPCENGEKWQVYLKSFLGFESRKFGPVFDNYSDAQDFADSFTTTRAWYSEVEKL